MRGPSGEGRDSVPADRRKTSVEWPAVVDDRLRLLVSLAEEAGEVGATSASELLAALICAQPQSTAHLADTIITYRQAAHETIGTPGSSAAKVPHRPRRGRPRLNRIKNSSRAGSATHEPDSQPGSNASAPEQREEGRP
jgi:hypothetical protein